MATKTYSYLGKGMVYLRNRSSGGGLKQVGNCSALEFSVETDTLTQADYTQAGGGNANEIQRVSSVGSSITSIRLLHLPSPGIPLLVVSRVRPLCFIKHSSYQSGVQSLRPVTPSSSIQKQ